MTGGPVRVATVLAMLTSTLAPSGAEAIPPGPPEITIHAERVNFSLTYDVIVHASDPDGVIQMMSVCVEQDCATTERPSGPGEQALACLNGDSASLSIRHTFPSAGTFEAVAEALAGGCPLIGSEDLADQRYEVVVPEPPPPHDPITCSQPGDPSATDAGVYEDRVVLGSVVTLGGPGASFKGSGALGFRAAATAINQMGGVCDRRIELRLLDDGNSEERRRQLVRAMIDSGDVFALVSVPAHGFIADLEAAGMPDVGTLGDAVDEFSSPMVWPVGPGNHAFGWIAVDEAYELGARSFGIVYDTERPFGLETYEAVAAAVAAHEGATLSSAAGIQPARASYSAEIASFNDGCGDGCDAVILALEPATALTWLAGRPQQGTLRTSLHPGLFNDQYASNCGQVCDEQVAWTGFQHPFGDAPAAERACADMRAVSPTADCGNPYALAAYESVFLAAHAMGHAGVELTRTGFAAALDSNAFDFGLHGGPLSWAASRQANRWMRGYEVIAVQGSFAGWRDLTGWREDPR